MDAGLKERDVEYVLPFRRLWEVYRTTLRNRCNIFYYNEARVAVSVEIGATVHLNSLFSVGFYNLLVFGTVLAPD